MTKAKKPANYCAQTDIQTSCFVRVQCSACDTVLPLEEDMVQRQKIKTGGVILTVSVPPFCPRCLKAKETAEMSDPEICEMNGL